MIGIGIFIGIIIFLFIACLVGNNQCSDEDYEKWLEEEYGTPSKEAEQKKE